MNFNSPRPRVNGAMLPDNHGKQVVLLGLVAKPSPDGVTLTIMTPDRQEATVMLREPMEDFIQGLVEVHGMVTAAICKRNQYTFLTIYCVV